MMEGNNRRKEGSKHSEIHSSVVVYTPTIPVSLSQEISLRGEETGFCLSTMKTYLALNLYMMGFSKSCLLFGQYFRYSHVKCRYAQRNVIQMCNTIYMENYFPKLY